MLRNCIIKACQGNGVVSSTGTSAILLLNNISFDFDKAELKPESRYELDRLFRILSEREDLRSVEIDGHTDHIGIDNYNQQLSEQRAQSVVNYLTGKGISSFCQSGLVSPSCRNHLPVEAKTKRKKNGNAPSIAP